MFKSFILAVGLLSAGLPYGSQEHSADTLHSATVTADKGVVVSRTDTLSLKNSLTLSDALHQSPGLQIGDYGGIAGLKTVSLRGLGSAHTSIYIDGVRVGNVQSGQNDLGMIGTGNYGSVVVDYAQNSISFNTVRPVFAGRPVAGAARMSAGSFGTWLPSARLDFRLSPSLSLSAHADGIISRGDFIYADGLRRQNNDIRQVRGGLDLFGLMPGGDYHVKAFVNSAERGTPGSVSWPSEDRQKDMNAILQGVVRKRFSDLYSLQLSAKGSYDDIYYTSSWGDSRYGQTELQLNTSHLFRIHEWWNVSVAADVQWDALRSTNYNASRLTALAALTMSFRLDRLAANVAVEYMGTFDKDALSRNAVSPSIDVRFSILEGLDIVAFGRRAYRVPTFNELYYVGYGNPSLRPEDAWLTDLGLDFSRPVSHEWTVRAKVDGFLNLLSDKITSAPTVEDTNIWLPYNIGKVRSAGVDVLAGLSLQSGRWLCAFDARYSFQSAVDRTPDSYAFGQQIPYIARHSAVMDAKVSWNGLELNPRWILRSGRTDSMGALADWNTLDLTLRKSFSLPSFCTLSLAVSGRNLLDNRYELSSGYPMPGRSFLATLEFTF